MCLCEFADLETHAPAGFIMFLLHAVILLSVIYHCNILTQKDDKDELMNDQGEFIFTKKHQTLLAKFYRSQSFIFAASFPKYQSAEHRGFFWLTSSLCCVKGLLSVINGDEISLKLFAICASYTR